MRQSGVTPVEEKEKEKEEDDDIWDVINDVFGMASQEPGICTFFIIIYHFLPMKRIGTDGGKIQIQYRHSGGGQE